jgi:hypothetical protein
MAHHSTVVADEQYVFRPETRNKLFILLGVGALLFVIGLFMAIKGGGHHDEHAAVPSKELVANANANSVDQEEAHATEGHAVEGAHHEQAFWITRLFTTLWMNNIYFIGLGLIGLFFIAIQYAAQAGWSAGVLRVPMAMANWIPIAGILLIVLYFVTGHTIFHWTHADLYDEKSPAFDPIINGKATYFYWLGSKGGFPTFFIIRMVVFFAGWYWFFITIRRRMLAEDNEVNNQYWYQNRVTSTWFLIFFAVSSSVAAWDWVMSIDTHWFSTMFGWYVFASWWVTGLAMITLIVAFLKDAGYLKVVNSNHLHDLGKFVFAFSIFWTYIWFGQFLLIYYANIPEETVYFIERMRTSPYSWIFYLNLILNFVLPFLLFMTRDAKRQISTLKLVTPIVIVGHWFDFFNMVTPAVMKENGGVGLLEIGTFLIFMAVYLLVVLTSLGKYPLVGKNHPMLQESLHHHI